MFSSSPGWLSALCWSFERVCLFRCVCPALGARPRHQRWSSSGAFDVCVVRVCVCECLCLCLCPCVCLCLCLCLCPFVHVFVYVCMFVYVCFCVYMYMDLSVFSTVALDALIVFKPRCVLCIAVYLNTRLTVDIALSYSLALYTWFRSHVW